jgi:quercetin dioxygenase-like cupin family protein
MKVFQLLDNLQFHEKNPYAEPLSVSETGRILRFTLRPGQSVREHNAPHSPLHIVVLKGHGLFAGPDGHEQRFSPNTLLVFEPGENHAIRAVDEELIFLAFLRENK